MELFISLKEAKGRHWVGGGEMALELPLNCHNLAGLFLMRISDFKSHF